MQRILSKPIVVLAIPLWSFGCTQSYELAPVINDDQRLNGYYWEGPVSQGENSENGNRNSPVFEQNVPGNTQKKAELDTSHLTPKTSDKSGLKKQLSSAKDENTVGSRERKVNFPSDKQKKTNKTLLSKPSSKDNKPAKPKKKSIISIDNKNMLMLEFGWPIKGTVHKSYSRNDKKGIDITGAIGQTVKASEAGKVVYSGQGLIGFGNLLIIKHNDVYLSAYANNSSLLVKEGQYVKKGQGIAKVGMAVSKKALLHFEIRKNGKSVNPLLLLP